MVLDSDKELNYIESTASANPTLNAITGTLGKTFDTFLDALAVQGAGKLIGSTYPTGQQNPASVAAQNQALANQQAATNSTLKTYLLYGGIAVGGLIALVIVSRALSK